MSERTEELLNREQKELTNRLNQINLVKLKEHHAAIEKTIAEYELGLKAATIAINTAIKILKVDLDTTALNISKLEFELNEEV